MNSWLFLLLNRVALWTELKKRASVSARVMLIRNLYLAIHGGQAADEAIFSVTCPHKLKDFPQLRKTPPLLPFCLSALATNLILVYRKKDRSFTESLIAITGNPCYDFSKV
ncbi:MAG: hypothetical protein ACFFCP_13790 [Promethearchaeota archaeon]